MPNLTTSADIDTLMQAANFAAARTSLGLTALATTTPGTGVATALGVNVGSAGAFLTFNGAGGTPSSLTGTNITGTAAGLTAGTASAVAVGGITGLGANVATALAVNVGSAGAFLTFNGAGGTPSSLTGTNITGTAAGLTAGTASAVAVGGITGLGTGVATFLATPSSANLASAVTGEVGSGALVFGTSPTFTTSVVTDSATLAVFNTVATTVNAFGVATALNIGLSAATVFNFGGFTSAAEMRFLEPSGSGTNYSGFKQPALTTSITYLWPSDAPANGDVLTCQSNGTLSWETPSGAANAVTAAATAAGAGLFWVSDGADRSATATDTINAATITTATVGTLVAGSATMSLYNTVATTINFAGVATALNIGAAAATVMNFGGHTSAAEMRYLEPSGSGTNYIGFKAVAMAASTTYTWPAAAATAGQVLTAGATPTALEWTTPAGGGNVTAAGTLTSGSLMIGQGTTATAVTTTGTGVVTALGVNVGSAGAFVTFNGAGGTPSAITLTNGTALPVAGITSSTSTALGVGSLEVGNASDTTISRASAGDIQIETNIVYRAGGTDVPVTDGGTGRSTGTTAYALVATGTTATGAQQTLASGATTEILVGGGASALPVWTTATGSGAPARATSPTFVTPVLGTPASGNLGSCTADGTNAVGYRNVPQNAKTGSYTLLATDVGKVVPNTTGGWTVNNSVHTAGDVILVYNDSASSQNITAGTITTMRLAGSATTGTRALAARGIATIYFQTASECVVSGTGVT